ncbi:MAG: YkgB family protein [Candidatus Binatia bacterium]
MKTVAASRTALGSDGMEAPALSADWARTGAQVKTWGGTLIRYGLVLVLGWIGAMKFTGYEAEGIQPLVVNSPLMSWVYRVWSIQGFSSLLGTTEIAIAFMIALRPFSATVSALGSGLAVMMFLTTLSFLFSTPGWEPSLGGFPALSVVPGQFLLKDIVLLGAAVWSLGDSLQEI